MSNFENTPFNREKLTDRLKEALTNAFSDSIEIQQILETLEQKGISVNIWVLIGIYASHRHDQDQADELLSDDLQLNDDDLTWLNSLEIDSKNIIED